MSSGSKGMVRQNERKAQTRAAIISAAKEKFGTIGFAGTSVDAIAAQAKVAKGAVYHHFRNKEDLFECVFEIVSSGVAQSVVNSAKPDHGPLENLMLTTERYFELCADPPTARITLQDGPSVLGYERWRELDTVHFGGLVTAGLTSAMQAGAIVEQPVEPLSNIVLAAIQSAALDCAVQENFEAAASQYLASFAAILSGLAKER